MKPFLFLSHSAKDPTAKKLLNKLSKGLTALGWDVFVDEERLREGTEWLPQLHTALGACDAAVMLFSQDAYSVSKWVLKEATVFTWRRALEPTFPIVPVLFPDITRKMLSEGRFEGLGLGAIVPVEVAKAKANIVNAVHKALGTQQAGLSPIERVQQAVAERFKNIAPGNLKLASLKLGKTITWQQPLEPHQQFARNLFHTDVALVRAALAEIATYMKPSEIREVINLLAPFTVEPLAIAPIPAIVRHDIASTARPVIAVNSKEEDTGHRYVQRARCHTDHWTVVTLANAGGHDASGSLAGELLREIRLQVTELANSSDADIKAMLETLHDDGAPLFVLVHGPVDPSTLDGLRGEFPSCVFFVLAGEPVDEEALKQDGIKVLTPKLDSKDETRIRNQITLARLIAANREKQSA